MALYQKYLEPVIEEFSTGDYYSEVYAAKNEYFQKTGVVYEDDIDFDERMNIFMDWFLFDRDLPGVDLPPIKYYFRKNQDQFSNEETKIYRDFCATLHSVFRLKRFSFFKKDLVIEDLFTKKTYVVTDKEVAPGLSRGDIFEARIIPFKGSYEFSKGFCFHPTEMRSFIVGEIKKVRNQERTKHTKLILQLAAMKLKHKRFTHIDIQHIYRFDSRL